jgi:hypothetical protein
MSKKFYLDELIDELRSLANHYEVDEDEQDVFVLNSDEYNSFSEDILKSTKKYLDITLSPTIDIDDLEEDIESLEEGEEIFWVDDDDILE